MIGRYRARNNYQGGSQGGPEGQPDLMGVEFDLPTAAYEADFRLMNAAGVSADEWGVGDYPGFPHTRPARILSWNTKPFQLVVNGTWGNKSVPTYILWEHTIELDGGAATKDLYKWGVAFTPTSRNVLDVYTTEAGSVYRANLDTNIFKLNGHRDGLMASFTITSTGRTTTNLGVIGEVMDITQFTSPGVAAPPPNDEWLNIRPGLLFIGEDDLHWAKPPSPSSRGRLTAYSAYPATFKKIGDLE